MIWVGNGEKPFSEFALYWVLKRKAAPVLQHWSLLCRSFMTMSMKGKAVKSCKKVQTLTLSGWSSVHASKY